MLQIPRSVHANYFLVKINRQKQKDKREKLGDIYLNPNNVFATRNQQCGEVVCIGSRPYPAKEIKQRLVPDEEDPTGKVWIDCIPYFDYSAAEYFPEVWVGDTLLFHHNVEGSMDTKNGDKRQEFENNKRILMEDDEWRLYLVPIDQVYGVAKKDGTIITAPDWLFCQDPTEMNMDGVEVDETGRLLTKTQTGLILFANYEPSESEKRIKLKDLEMEIESLSKTGVGEQEGLTREKNYVREQVKQGIIEKMTEMQALTKTLASINVRPFILMHGNNTFNRDCGVTVDDTYAIMYNMVGKKVTTLEYEDKTFCILKTSQILYLYKIK